MTYPIINGATINGLDAPSGDGGGPGYAVASLTPVTFGPIAVATGHTGGLEPARIPPIFVVTGMPPARLWCPAASTLIGRFGTPAAVLSLTLDAPLRIEPVRFGAVRLRTSHAAAPTRPCSVGPTRLRMAGRPEGLRLPVFGVPSVRATVRVSAVRPPRFGLVRSHVGGMTATPASLRPVAFGGIAEPRSACRVRATHPVEFGCPSVAGRTVC